MSTTPNASSTTPSIEPPEPPLKPLSGGLLLLMSTATGLAVASNYYAQPLLPIIANEMQLSPTAAANIVTTAQLSYGAGLLLLVPLADLFERRALIITLMLLAALGLVLTTFAPTLPLLLLGTTITGLCSVVTQVMVPLAATLSAPAQRGRAVGTMMSGLLIGILLARTVAGLISTLAGWRTVFAVAAIAIILCTIALARALPRYRQTVGLSYGQLLASVFALFRDEPVLRLRATLGLLTFVLFSMFWTPLSFLLSSPPYGYSEAVIGLFGLVGAAGALSASWAGRLADRGKGELGTLVGIGTLLISWLPLAFAQQSLLALILGVLLLDLAVQLVHVSNQNAIYAIRPEARSRLTAGYMTCYFIGGATGSAIAAYLYTHHGWMGIVIASTAIAALTLAIGIIGLRKKA